MIDNIEYYMEYLDGLTKDMPEEFVKLAQVFELSVFEPVYMEGEDDIYAAYLMNDSVESYFVFENSIMTGEYKNIDCEQVAGIETLSDGCLQMSGINTDILEARLVPVRSLYLCSLQIFHLLRSINQCQKLIMCHIPMQFILRQ